MQLPLSPGYMSCVPLLQKKRREIGFSQKEFADKLGMSQSTVARLETGQNMTCQTLWKVSDALHEDVSIFGVSKYTEKDELEEFLTFAIDESVSDATVASEDKITFMSISNFTSNNQLKYGIA